MTSGIATSVEQLLGVSRIPASAAPVTRPSLAKPKPAPKPKAPPKLRKQPREKLLGALDDEYRSEWALSVRAGISNKTAPRHLAELAEQGLAEVRATRRGRRVLLEYRGRG